jgi:hypothetical protein
MPMNEDELYTLLEKYIRWVYLCEGTTFIHDHGSEEYFSKEELEQLLHFYKKLREE